MLSVHKHNLDIRLTDDGKVVSLTPSRPLPTRFLVLNSVRSLVDTRALVRLEGLGQLKESTSSGLELATFPSCSMVPQPTTLPRAPR
jgi:hypothetical protein